MEKEAIFALISTVIYLIAVFPYLRDVLSWKTLPHPYSYLIWTIVLLISVSVLLYSGEYVASIPGITSAIISGIWCFYGFKSYWNLPINWFDKSCLLLALGTVIYGVLTRDFFNTIILAICIDLLAFLPTFKKWWILPWSETIITWFLAWIQYIFMLLALTHISFETAGFWVYNIVLTFLFFSVTFFRRCYLRWWWSVFD
jgi:hypothetical protein